MPTSPHLLHATSIWWTHSDLRSIRDTRVGVLADQASHLRQVAQPGDLGEGT